MWYTCTYIHYLYAAGATARCQANQVLSAVEGTTDCAGDGIARAKQREGARLTELLLWDTAHTHYKQVDVLYFTSVICTCTEDVLCMSILNSFLFACYCSMYDYVICTYISKTQDRQDGKFRSALSFPVKLLITFPPAKVWIEKGRL